MRTSGSKVIYPRFAAIRDLRVQPKVVAELREFFQGIPDEPTAFFCMHAMMYIIVLKREAGASAAYREIVKLHNAKETRMDEQRKFLDKKLRLSKISDLFNVGQEKDGLPLIDGEDAVDIAKKVSDKVDAEAEDSFEADADPFE